MTYYGRWTYKYEMGAKMGAAGVLIVHETGPAGYPFAVVQGKTAEQFDLVAPDKNMGRSAVEGWITLDQAKTLFASSGQDFDALKKQALTREFKPVSLGVTASVSLVNTIRTIESHQRGRQARGQRSGAEGRVRDLHDALGSLRHRRAGERRHDLPRGDRQRDGRRRADRAGAGLHPGHAAPKRSILFLFVTAEEQGLLGSDYYAQHPLYPLAKTLAVLNLDALNVHGKTRDMTIVGLGLSSLDDSMQKAAASRAG